MKFFIVEVTYTVNVVELGEIVGQHRNFLQTGFDKGWLLCSGPQVPRIGGMVVARAPSLNDLKDFFRNDPYQIKGLATYRFTEFEPVKNQPFLQPWIAGEEIQSL